MLGGGDIPMLMPLLRGKSSRMRMTLLLRWVCIIRMRMEVVELGLGMGMASSRRMLRRPAWLRLGRCMLLRRRRRTRDL